MNRPIDLRSPLQNPAKTLLNSVPELRSMLKPFFVSSSTGIPPKSSGTGGRIVMLTNQSAAAQSRPTDTADIAMVAGKLTWYFSVAFTQTPLVTFGVLGTPPSAGTTLYIDTTTLTDKSVTIKSTDGTDTRTVHLVATASA